MQHAEAQRRVHPQPAARLHGRSPGQGLGFGDLVEDRAAALVQGLAAFGQRQPARGAVQQPRAQVRFELADVAGHVGRGRAQRIGGPREPAACDHATKTSNARSRSITDHS